MAEKTEMRHLNKPERARKGWRHQEQMLLNLHRKLSNEERISVYVYAERLTLARIRARLAQRRRAR